MITETQKIQSLTGLCKTYQKELKNQREKIRKLKTQNEELRNKASYYKHKLDKTGSKKQRPKISKNKRTQTYERDNYTCQICGCKKDLTIDHFIPLSKGGGNDINNLWTLCEACNREKADKIYDNKKFKEI